MIAALLSPVGRWLAGAAAIAVLVGGVLFRAFAAGKASTATAQRDAELKASRDAREIEVDTAAMTPAAQRAELQKWARHQ